MENDGKVKIIEAAQRLIAKSGVEKKSMRSIAEEAGITTGARDYVAQVDRTAHLLDYVFDTEAKPEDLSLAVIMNAALDGINLQQVIGALPVDSKELARI